MSDDTGLPADPNTPSDMPEATPPIGYEATTPGQDWAVPAVQARKSPLRYVTAVIGILAIAGGAVFAASSLRKNSGGGSTPEAATRNFLAAVANEDLVGVMGTLLPGEREALKRPLSDMAAELSRLGVLKSGTSLSKITGVDVGFKDLSFETKTLDADHAVVSLTGGTGSVKFDPAQLPLGPFVTDKVGQSLRGGERSVSGPVSNNKDARFATVREGSSWYVSLTFSIAESAREEAGAPVPDFSKKIQPRGETSPERATEAMIRALVAYDFETAIALLPPDEMQALHEYAPSFIGDAKSLAAELRKKFGIEISSLELDSQRSGDEAVVRVKRMEFKAVSTDGKTGVAYDGNCLIVKGVPGGFPPQVCSKDLLEQSGIPGTKAPNIGIVTVERGGKWYVSPIRTTLDSFTAVLKSLEPADLDRIGSLLGGIAGGGFPSTG